MSFIYEVSRPSRRFRKVNMHDLDLLNPGTTKTTSSSKSTIVSFEFVLFIQQNFKEDIHNSFEENDLFYDAYSDADSDEI